jgi:RecJ-like exonuclease
MIANISASRQGDRITVFGEVSDIWEPAGKRAPHTIILRDDSGALEIVHWLKHPPRVDIGDSVECTGTVDLYRGGLQLRLWTPEDLQALDP